MSPTKSSPTKDQKLVEKFLHEFVDKLTKRHGKDIDFILLFGSAARGEWKKGMSDVDLIIQTKTRGSVEPIKNYAEKLFWQLDRKYGTEFRKVCSIGSEEKSKKLLSKAKLYVPFEIFAPGDMDWKNGEIKRKDLYWGAKLIASQGTLFLKMKKEGKILYGRDIRKEIYVKNTLWEKFKAILIPFYLSMIGLVGSIFNPAMAVKLADKGVIYSIESALFFMDLPVGGGTTKAMRTLEKKLRKKFKLSRNLLGSMELDFIINVDYRKIADIEFARKAIELKYNLKELTEKMGRKEALSFCFNSLKFVLALNLFALVSNVKTRKYVQAAILLFFILIVYGSFVLFLKYLI